MPHTPGPWRVYRDKDMRPSKIESRDGRLCTFHPSDKNKEANVCLIAAAPELLEALETLLKRIEYDREAKHWFLDEQSQARAVLAKAKGMTV